MATVFACGWSVMLGLLNPPVPPQETAREFDRLLQKVTAMLFSSWAHAVFSSPPVTHDVNW